MARALDCGSKDSSSILDSRPQGHYEERSMKRKLKGEFTATLWDGETGEKGVNKNLSATMAFDIKKPRCDRCTNPNKRVTVQFDRKNGSKFKLCLDCVTDLVTSINQALKEFQLVRLIMTGVPASEAVEQVSNETIGKEDLSTLLNSMIDSMYDATGEERPEEEKLEYDP